jgi:hypothetical protein
LTAEPCQGARRVSITEKLQACRLSRDKSDRFAFAKDAVANARDDERPLPADPRDSRT